MKLKQSEIQAFINAIATFPKRQIVVVGDVMLDEYIWGAVTRISPEAPVPVADVQTITHVPGGSANVARNLAALGATAHLVGAIGNDSTGQKLRRTLKRFKIATSYLLVDRNKPTTLKSRIVAHNQHVIRVDREDSTPPHDSTLTKLKTYVTQCLRQADVLLLSDYNKGLLSPAFTQWVIRAAKQKKIPIAVDPKGTHYGKYRGATLVTPNLHEAEVLTKLTITHTHTLRRAARVLQQKMRLPYLLITQGKDGMTLFGKAQQATHVPATASEVYDITGAGDTVISTLVLCLASGLAAETAVKLANLAAGLVVQKVGTGAVTRQELIQALRQYQP